MTISYRQTYIDLFKPEGSVGEHFFIDREYDESKVIIKDADQLVNHIKSKYGDKIVDRTGKEVKFNICDYDPESENPSGHIYVTNGDNIFSIYIPRTFIELVNLYNIIDLFVLKIKSIDHHLTKYNSSRNHEKIVSTCIHHKGLLYELRETGNGYNICSKTQKLLYKDVFTQADVNKAIESLYNQDIKVIKQEILNIFPHSILEVTSLRGVTQYINKDLYGSSSILDNGSKFEVKLFDGLINFDTQDASNIQDEIKIRAYSTFLRAKALKEALAN